MMRKTPSLLSLATIGLVAGCLALGYVVADDVPKATPAQPETPKLDPKAAEELARLCTPPATDNLDELLAFTQKVIKFRPASLAEAMAYRERAPAALKAAADKIQSLEKDKKTLAWRTAEGILLQQRITELGNGNGAEHAAKLLADTRSFIDGSELGMMEFQVAQGLASALEYSDNTSFAAEVYTTFGNEFKTSGNAQVADMADTMVGAGRRLSLVGKPLELTGTTVDGEPFDIKDLRGKVVLIDFWATWCGPCRKEHPNIEKNYSAYKDKGFEVVGISLDREEKKLTDYLHEHNTQWITLYDKQAGGQHPAAKYYGVFGIPAMMLVDQEGIVVTLNARGDELSTQLARLLADSK